MTRQAYLAVREAVDRGDLVDATSRRMIQRVDRRLAAIETLAQRITYMDGAIAKNAVVELLTTACAVWEDPR